MSEPADWLNPCSDALAALSPECRAQLQSPRALITPARTAISQTLMPTERTVVVNPTLTQTMSPVERTVVVNPTPALLPTERTVLINPTVAIPPVKTVVQTTPSVIVNPTPTIRSIGQPLSPNERIVTVSPIPERPLLSPQRVVTQTSPTLSVLSPPAISNASIRTATPMVQLQPTVSTPINQQLRTSVIAPLPIISPLIQPSALSPPSSLVPSSPIPSPAKVLGSPAFYSSPAEAPTIVVFNQSAVVTEISNLGEIHLSATAIPSSIVAFGLNSVTVDEIVRVNGNITSETIVRENSSNPVDYRVETLANAFVSKGSEGFEGVLVDRNDKTVTLKNSFGDTVVVRNYDWLRTNGSQQVVVTSGSAAISYLTDELSWTPRGVAAVDPTNKTITFTVLGDINVSRNIHANVVLANDLLNQTSRAPRMAAMSLSAQPIGLPPQSKGVGGAPRYNLGFVAIEANVVDVNKNANVTNISMVLDARTLPVNKLHLVNTSDPNRIQVGYEFTATGYIPACTVSIYDDKGYSGSTNIEAAETGEQVILAQGDAVDVRSTVKVIKDVQYTPNLNVETSFSPGVGLVEVERADTKLGWYTVTEDIRAEIITEKPLKLLLRHSIDDRVFLRASTLETRPNRRGFLEWLLDIPIGTTQIAVEVQTAEFRDTL